MVEPVQNYVLTKHARIQMQRRGIDEAIVHRILSAPEQRFSVRSGREVLQSRIMLEGRRFLVRVFVEVNRQPAEVVTVYRTTKIDKYWRKEL